VKLIDRFHTHTQSNLKELIHWFETHVKNFTLQLTPMVIANQFQQYIKNHKRSWIFTSATLTVQNSFKLFIDSLGLHQALQLALDSPFDYQKQAILYAPRGLPDTRDSHYMQSRKNIFFIYEFQSDGGSVRTFKKSYSLSIIATRYFAQTAINS
jgi:Rad3-related DNA helicase